MYDHARTWHRGRHRDLRPGSRRDAKVSPGDEPQAALSPREREQLLRNRRDAGQWAIYSYPLYQQFRDHTPEFSEMSAFQAGLSAISLRRVGAPGAAEPYVGEFVSGNYFQMFGLSAFAGRAITPDDDKANAAPVAVLSYRTWQQHFGLDPSVVGATFTVNTVPYTVVGIALRASSATGCAPTLPTYGCR